MERTSSMCGQTSKRPKATLAHMYHATTCPRGVTTILHKTGKVCLHLLYVAEYWEELRGRHRDTGPLSVGVMPHFDAPVH